MVGFGDFDLDFAIEMQIYENSNGECLVNIDDIEYSKLNNFFPHLKYFYSSFSFTDLYKSNYFKEKDLIRKELKNEYKIYLVENNLLVNIKSEFKPASEYINLKNSLKKKSYKLEGILDIEFFETQHLHNNYLKLLLSDEKLNLNYKLEDGFDFSREYIIDYFKKMDGEKFEGNFFYKNDPTNLIYDLDLNSSKISKDVFSSFLDTEKIHLQFAIVSSSNKKNVPLLAYFGYGNYYPFSKRIKNKDLRFERFSNLSNSDNIDINYYIKQMQIKSDFRKKNLIEKLDFSQQNYYNYFIENFDIEKRYNYFKKKYNNLNFDLAQYSLLQINPLIRTKSAALIARKIFLEEFDFSKYIF